MTTTTTTTRTTHESDLCRSVDMIVDSCLLHQKAQEAGLGDATEHNDMYFVALARLHARKTIQKHLDTRILAVQQELQERTLDQYEESEVFFLTVLRHKREVWDPRSVEAAMDALGYGHGWTVDKVRERQRRILQSESPTALLKKLRLLESIKERSDALKADCIIS